MTAAAMLRRLLLLASLPLAAACSGKAQTPSDPAGGVVTSLREVIGPWDIARFGGYTPVRLDSSGIRRAYVDVSADRLSYAIECNYSGNPAHIDRSGILHDDGDGSRVSTAMGCGPEGEARESAFFTFFSSKPKVSWDASGGLRIANGRTELILERPEVRRLANAPALEDLAGTWVPQSAHRLLGGNGYEGWGFQEPGLVTITSDRLTYSGCGGASFAFRYSREGRMTVVGDPGNVECGSDTPPRAFLRVLRNGPMVERMSGGGIALSAGSEVISLQSEKELRRLRDNPQPPPAGAAPPPPPPPQPSA